MPKARAAAQVNAQTAAMLTALPPIWATLRDHFPVYRTAYDMWVVSRYEDVRFIQQNPQLFSSKPNADEASALPREYPGWMLEFQNREPRGVPAPPAQ